MKKALISLILILAAGAALSAATWTGNTSTAWNVGSNWDTGSVPNNTIDAIIPNTARKPVINATANCKILTVLSGSSVTINSSYNLNVSDYAGIYGALNMSSTGDLFVTNTLFFESGSTASITSADATIYLSYNLQFASGSNVQMTNGRIYMQGSVASTELANYSANTQIYALTVAKSPGTSFSIRSGGQPLTVNNHIYNSVGCTFYNYYTGNITLKGNLVDQNSDSAYGIKWGNGTLIISGTSPSIGLQSSSCYLNNLTFSQTGTSQLTYPLTVRGNLRIENGIFYPQAHNITVGGDWENVVGPSAFTEGTAARVIFNGSGFQYCNYTETFNILEVNKSGGALRVNNSSAVVTCAQYDWTAGAVDVITGTFTANDLVDNGIYGSYFVNPGATINLTNNDGWVDLNGSMTFTNGGTINVYGGTVTSDWSYSGNASLTMTNGGVLDFKNQGINIYNSATYTFTYSISGAAEIRTAGNFTCNRSTFTPTAGYVVMYGSTDATLTMNAGSLYILKVLKSATREADQLTLPIYIADKLTGTTSEVTRANTVTLATNVTCTDILRVEQGTLDIAEYQLNCREGVIYSNLKMNNSAAHLNVTYNLTWFTNSTANVTLGTITVKGAWQALMFVQVILPTAVTVNLACTTPANIHISSPDMQFGTLNIGGAATTGGVFTVGGVQPLQVAGNLTIRSGNELDMGTRDLTVNGDLNLNGTLEIHATSATVQGKLELAATSTIIIDSGSLTCNNTSIPRTTYLRGTFTLNTGTLTLTNNSLTVLSGSVNNINGGTINCDGIIAQSADTFRPTGGTVNLGDLYGGGTFANWVGANNWVHNLTIDAGTQGYRLDNALVIKGNLILQSGGFDTQNTSGTVFNVTISGNWSHMGGTFYPRTGRVIFTGAGHQYVNYTETFNIVEVDKSSGALRVDSSTAVVTIAQYDWTLGAVDVISGTLTINDLADNGLFGGYYCTPGGILNVSNTDGRVDINGTVQVTGGTMTVYGSGISSYWPWAGNASLTMSGGRLDFRNAGIAVYNSGSYTLTCNISGGNISTDRSFWCNRTDFAPTGGTLEMMGSTDATITFATTGSRFHHLTINKAATRETEAEGLLLSEPVTRANTATLSSNIVLYGNLTIQAGTLDVSASNYQISLRGNWNNQVGPDAFVERAGRVVFNGTSNQSVGVVETFNILELNKSAGNLVVTSSEWMEVTVNSYDWTAGSVLVHDVGRLIILDLIDDGIFGSFTCNNASVLNIRNLTGRIDLNGVLSIGGGTVNITGSGSPSQMYIPYAANATLQITSGNLNLINIGLAIVTHATYTFTQNLSFGTITMQGDLYCNRNDFLPLVDIRMSGTNNSTIVFNTSASQLRYLVVEKTGSAWVSLNTSLTVNDMTAVVSGKLFIPSGKTLTGGSIYIAGTLEISAGSTLKIGDDENLSVDSGGLLMIAGTSAFRVLITRSGSAYYSARFYAGSTLTANYVDFEYLNTSGLWFLDGATLNGFHNCAFRYGQASGTSITFYNQTAVIHNADFSSTGSNYNVTSYGQNMIVFHNATGAMAGPAYEFDMYDSVYWTGDVNDLTVSYLGYDQSWDYVAQPVNAYVNILNSGNYDIITPVRADLYLNRTSPPPSGTAGDLFQSVDILKKGNQAAFVFSNLSSPIGANWFTYARVDALNAISESNEGNNILGPVAKQWVSLPAVENLTISQLNPVLVRLDWEYPIWAHRFKVYRGDTPDFVPGPSNLFAWPTVPGINTSGLSQRYFYKVFAERDLP